MSTEQRGAGMGVAELRRLKLLEEENCKLKQLVADLSLDKKMLQDEDVAGCRQMRLHLPDDLKLFSK